MLLLLCNMTKINLALLVNKKEKNMKKIILSIAVAMIAMASFANESKMGPFLKVTDEVKPLSFGVTNTGKVWQATYVKDDDNRFALVRPVSKLPHAGDYFGGLFKDAEIVDVVTTTGSDVRVSWGILTPVLKSRLPFLGTQYRLDAGVGLPAVGGSSFNSIRVAREGQLILNFKLNL